MSAALDPRGGGLEPLDLRSVLLLFRLGMDTLRIARIYGLAEGAVANLLALARDEENARHRADDAAFEAAGAE